MQSKATSLISKRRVLFFIFSFLLLIVLVTSVILLYIVFIDLPFQQKILKKTNNEYLLKMAEESYNNGYYENSAIYYRNYLDTDPDKISKIHIYERMFEIHVINKKNQEALDYLKLWEKIDSGNPKIFINRLKLLFRIGNYQEIKNEIDRNAKKMSKSTEFIELISIYFIKIGKIDNALKTLERIPFNKREFAIHKKIIYCYIKLEKYKDALNYIKKIEKKVKLLELKDNKVEFVLLKSIVLILSDEYIFAYEELKNLVVNEQYNDLYLKVFLYCNIRLDRVDEINSLLDNNSNDILDTDYYKMIADYFIYKNDLRKSLSFYEKIKSQRNLTQHEVMVLSDIYYHLGEYENAMNAVNLLHRDFNLDSADFYRNLSIVNKRLNNSNDEFFYLKEGMRKFPLDLDFYVRLSQFYLQYRDYNSAIMTINQADEVFRKNQNLKYDQRFDLIRLIATERYDEDIGELDFLKLREKNNTNPLYYFKIIELYLKKNRFSDAKREIENVSALSLNESQSDLLNIYNLLYGNFTKDVELYEKARKKLMEGKIEDVSAKINIAIIYLLEEEFNTALDFLNTIDLRLTNDEIKKKIFYLKAIIYYYKNDYPASYKLLQQVLELDQGNQKASYIKSLIEKSVGE